MAAVSAVGSPHAGVPLVAMCGCRCRQPQVFGMVCHGACARTEMHRGECLCSHCLIARVAMRVLAEQAAAKREIETIEHMVFAREGQRERRRATRPRRRGGAKWR